MWSVKCEVWSVKEAVGSEKCEVWTVKCEVWSVKCGVWSFKFGVRRVQCEVWSVKTLLRLSLKKSNGCRGKDTVGTGCLWTIGHLCLGNFRRRLARVYVILLYQLSYPFTKLVSSPNPMLAGAWGLPGWRTDQHLAVNDLDDVSMTWTMFHYICVCQSVNWTQSSVHLEFLMTTLVDWSMKPFRSKVEPPIPEFLAKKFVIIPSRTTSSQETNQSETTNQVWIGKNLPLTWFGSIWITNHPHIRQKKSTNGSPNFHRGA